MNMRFFIIAAAATRYWLRVHKRTRYRTIRWKHESRQA